MAGVTVKPILIGKIYHVRDGNLSVIVYSTDSLSALGRAYEYVYGGRTTI